ncbi:MAG: sterol desaturase family protein [Gammaproteobacteria bacterium]|nr:sterol desaturase family protein [Gammaproteobacteria bacterium]
MIENVIERFLNTVLIAFEGLVAPRTGLHWFFLACALVIALLVYWFRDAREDAPTLRSFLRYCFPGRIYRHRSAKLDFRYVAVNTLFTSIFLAPLLLSSVAVSHHTWMGLQVVFGQPGPQLPGGLVSDVILTFAVLILADLGFYVAHYIAHRVPFFWEFHKVHHSAEVLHPVTSLRAHPMDSVLSNTFQGVGTGVAFGSCYYLFNGEVDELRFVGLNAVVFLFTAASFNLRHSHVWLDYGRILNRVFISPAHHQIHHSVERRHADRNLGLVFAWWDWLGGTLYAPDRREELSFGLCDREESREYSSVWRLYVLPICKLADRMRGAVIAGCPWAGTGKTSVFSHSGMPPAMCTAPEDSTNRRQP